MVRETVPGVKTSERGDTSAMGDHTKKTSGNISLWTLLRSSCVKNEPRSKILASHGTVGDLTSSLPFCKGYITNLQAGSISQAGKKLKSQSLSVHHRTVFNIKKKSLTPSVTVPAAASITAFQVLYLSLISSDGFIFSFSKLALSYTSPSTPFPETCDNHCLGNSILPGVFY